VSSVLTKSIQKELNSFFSKLTNKDYNIQAVTKGALTQARAKLKPEAFIELSDLAVNDFYENAAYRQWKGYRILAIDGSTSNLPNHSSVKKEFGVIKTGCKSSVESSIARISLLYDVLNCITLDAQFESTYQSECNILKKHISLNKLKSGDILLTDRGYGSNALMYELKHKGIDFCIRMRQNWNEVNNFISSDEKSRIIKLPLPSKDRHIQQKYDSAVNYVTCRLVCITLDTGEKEILCTSLLDEKKYTIEDIKGLYKLRWNIEEAYKLLKVRMQLSNYSGKTSNSIRQDFFAKIFMMNMCSIMSYPIEEKVRKENETNKGKHHKKVNRTNILFTLKDAWISIWLKKKYERLLYEFDNIVFKTKEIIRPGRRFKRKKYRYPDRKPSQPYKNI